MKKLFENNDSIVKAQIVFQFENNEKYNNKDYSKCKILADKFNKRPNFFHFIY